MRIDCVLPLCRDDIPRAELLLASIGKFFRFGHRLMLVTPRESRDEVVRLSRHASDAVVLLDEDVVPSFADPQAPGGWWRQQALKLAVSKKIESDYYWILDADCLAVRPIHLDDFLVDGKGMVHIDPSTDHANWYRGSALVLDSTIPARRGIQVTPCLLHRDSAREVCRRIELLRNNPWFWLVSHTDLGANGGPWPDTWTEYCLYHCWTEQTDLFSRHHHVTETPVYGNCVWFPEDLPRWNPANSFYRPEFLFTVVQSTAKVPLDWLRSQIGPYLNSGNRPWLRTVEEFRRRRGKRIVEIGSLRSRGNVEGDGCSTIVWAGNAEEVYTVDIDPGATRLAAEETRHYGNAHAVTSDGIEFLASFNQPIDLLYLDGWDIRTAAGEYLPEAAEKHRDAYRTAKKNLHERSLVLIDDTFVDGRGKGELAIPEMLEDGWEILFEEYQTLLSRRETN